MSKKVLVFTGMRDIAALEEAVVLKEEHDYDVYFVTCDKLIGGCYHNPLCSTLQCRFCHYTMKKKIMELTKKSEKYHYISISDLLKKHSTTDSNNYRFEYNDVRSLKEITYKGVDVGYGAFSSFVTFTRNVMPTFNSNLKTYLDFFIRKQMLLTDMLIEYIDKIKPDCIVFHNGRFNNFKPAYNIAKNRKIDFIATEYIFVNGWNGGPVKKNIFINDIPHSFSAIAKKMQNVWNQAPSDKYDIAKRFFENRRKSLPAGDIIYTKDQHQNELPDGFNKSKRNIAIFNSSEDEFFAISREMDKSVLFPTQFDALKKIFEHYKNDLDVHFYLRIHPNLKNVPYKSHTLLYTLKYDNVTIIPPTSTVSSYALMDNSEKVIVFNSTMGMESSFWGKPVIALNRCMYTDEGIVYSPENEQELYCLINNVNLPKIDRPIESWYKLAYYLLGYGAEDLKYYATDMFQIQMLGMTKKGISFTVFKFLKSSWIHGFIVALIRFLSLKGIGSKFNQKFIDKTSED
ncbi:MAG: hypothetical protein J6U21_04960 [Bacteroidales bacterium]|nr:hypothetical protein [Bacteroidales bacterium]